MRILVAIPFITALAGCGLIGATRVSEMDSAQIRTANEIDLCNPYAGGPNVAAERARRNLGDCTAEHRQCLAIGYPAGSEGYLQCRSMYAQQNAIQAAQQAANAQALLAASAAITANNNQPIAVQPMQSILPQQTRCRSMQVGITVQTVCQ